MFSAKYVGYLLSTPPFDGHEIKFCLAQRITFQHFHDCILMKISNTSNTFSILKQNYFKPKFSPHTPSCDIEKTFWRVNKPNFRAHCLIEYLFRLKFYKNWVKAIVKLSWSIEELLFLYMQNSVFNVALKSSRSSHFSQAMCNLLANPPTIFRKSLAN